MSHLNPSPPKPLSPSIHDASPSRRPRSSKKLKAHPGLVRASSSLDVTATFEAFRSFEDLRDAENNETGGFSPSQVTSLRQSHSTTISTPIPRTPTKASVATDHVPLSSSNNTKAHQQPSTPTKAREDSKMVVDALPKEVMDDISSSKTFYGGIHEAYNTSCRELNALFGEVNLEGLRSHTKREVCQVELLHLLAVSTDDPGTYHGSIKRVGQICRMMSHRDIAENLWKKTLHIAYELDEDFEAKEKPMSDSGHSPSQPLSTIVEEDEGQPHDNQSGNQYGLQQKSHSASAHSRISASTADIKANARPMANPPAHLPVFSEENLASKAYDDYIAALSTDVLRRKEATDRYIAELEDDIAQRKYATDQYIAELEAKVQRLG